jgi:hypothetical protein
MRAIAVLLVVAAPGVADAGADRDPQAPRWIHPPRVSWSRLVVGCMNDHARFEVDLAVEEVSPVRIEVVARPVSVDGATMRAVMTPDQTTIRWPSGEGFLQAGEEYLASVCAEDAAGNRACEPMRFIAPIAVPHVEPAEPIREPPPPGERLRRLELPRSRIDWTCATAGAAGAAVVLLIAGLRRAARRRLSRAA